MEGRKEGKKPENPKNDEKKKVHYAAAHEKAHLPSTTSVLDIQYTLESSTNQSVRLPKYLLGTYADIA